MYNYAMEKNGFTLIEISIILVIIGLIIGGIFSGKSLIENAKNQKAIDQLNRYTIAINSFNDTYAAFPGDMVNAEAYWTSAVTSNGNGDSIINNPIVEGILAWQHLSLSGKIAESYSGLGSQYVTGVSIPENAYGRRWYVNNATLTSFGQVRASGNHIKMANGDNNVHWCAGVPIASTIYIDKKIDDGKAVTGRVIGWNPCGGESACVSSDQYILTNEGFGCQLHFFYF